jgi:hypothetical protein
MMVAPSYCRSGAAIDLAKIGPDDIDFREIAETLGRLPRWGARNFGAPYSVARHCAAGAEAIFGESADRAAAAHFLLHDAHEAFIGDLQVPTVRLIAWATGSEISAGALRTGIDAAKARLDRAIFAAAGFSPTRATHAAVKAMDRRMAAAEALKLFGVSPPAGMSLPRLGRSGCDLAAGEEWLAAFDRFVGRRIDRGRAA